MSKLRFLIVGSGWRSLFYVRIARALPERFEVCAMLCRSQEKAEAMHREYGVATSTSQVECMAMKPDFVVVAVTKASIASVSRFWMEAGFPVLCETPPSLELTELSSLWQLRTESGLRLQVAEQYFNYPTLASRLAVVQSGVLGEPSSMTLSLAHGYHGASLIRHFLKVGMEPVRIWGKSYPVSVVETDSRWGPVTDGEVAQKVREHLIFEFESSRTAFFDFCNVQYHSFLRSRHMTVQGPYGELDDFTVRFLDEERRPVKRELEILTEDSPEVIRAVTMGEQTVYRNPFEDSGLPEDETAIAVMLEGMGDYIRTGTELYPLADALQDAYLAILMANALEQPGTVIASQPQIWNAGFHRGGLL